MDRVNPLGQVLEDEGEKGSQEKDHRIDEATHKSVSLRSLSASIAHGSTDA